VDVQELAGRFDELPMGEWRGCECVVLVSQSFVSHRYFWSFCGADKLPDSVLSRHYLCTAPGCERRRFISIVRDTQEIERDAYHEQEGTFSVEVPHNHPLPTY
jgi:hypothetical protein